MRRSAIEEAVLFPRRGGQRCYRAWTQNGSASGPDTNFWPVLPDLFHAEFGHCQHERLAICTLRSLVCHHDPLLETAGRTSTAFHGALACTKFGEAIHSGLSKGNLVGALSAHLFMMPYGTGEKEPGPWKNSEESWFFRSPGRQSTSISGDEDKVERRMSPRLLTTNQRQHIFLCQSQAFGKTCGIQGGQGEISGPQRLMVKLELCLAHTKPLRACLPPTQGHLGGNPPLETGILRHTWECPPGPAGCSQTLT